MSFTIGSLLAILPPTALRIPVTVLAVLLALTVTGVLPAWLGRGAGEGRALARNVIGGGLALGITYAIGHLVGRTIT